MRTTHIRRLGALLSIALTLILCCGAAFVPAHAQEQANQQANEQAQERPSEAQSNASAEAEADAEGTPLELATEEADAALAALKDAELAYLESKAKLAAAGSDAGAEVKAAVDVAAEAVQLRAEALREAAHKLEPVGGNSSPYVSAAVTASGRLELSDLSLGTAGDLLRTWFDRLGRYLVDEGPGLLFQLFLAIGLWILFGVLARLAARLLRRALASPRVRASTLLKDFLVGTISKGVMLVGFLVILNQVGFQVGPLLAGLGVAGFIAGFALQDVLGNFAAGVMILFYRPFDVGDFVRAGGELGTVREMSLVSTVLNTPDNQRLIVPNKKIWGETIQNVTANPTRRVDLVFGIGYGDDLAKAYALFERVTKAHPMVLAEPAPMIELDKLADSSVNFVVRPWVRTQDYWRVYFDLMRSMKEALDAEGISIPFPQRDVHLHRVVAKE
ncbi:MAG: mechanosensitive ion channel [Planctomycetaceae bacterium]|nr:mechanosensitive ion channel [Planctomycetaceae bacterium]